MQKALTRVDDLVQTGLIDPSEAAITGAVAENFSLRISPHALAQIAAGDRGDPIHAQYVPSADELIVSPGELSDPIGDAAHEPVKGLTHRYPDRVLLKPTHTCHVYCRFCFRREKVGRADAALDESELEVALDYIRQRPEIWEVILSGGDPLVLSNRRLGLLLRKLEEIAHVAVVRFHTRVPVAEPSRINSGLIRAMKIRPAVYVVVHVNHPRELTAEARCALALLVDNGIPLLSQTVLLKGVNNDTATLAELMRSLVAVRVKPYYLHHLDKARGTQHFRCSIAEGHKLMRDLRGVLSGLCQPTYVLDIPGGFGKVPIGPEYLGGQRQGLYQARDYRNVLHDYQD